MTYFCYMCEQSFTRKTSLERHLNDKRCKSPLLDDFVLLNEFIRNLKQKSAPEPALASVLEPISKINDINSLNLSYITPHHIKPLMETYDIDLLEEYISNIIYNKERPENHIVKYNTRYPPTFKCDSSILVLQDTKEKLTESITKIIRRHITRCLKFYKDDEDEEDFVEEYEKKKKRPIDKDLPRDVSKCIKKILNKILYDPEMKC